MKQDLYELIKTNCTVVQIHGFLKSHKENGTPAAREAIRLSGSEDALIANVKSCVTNKHIPVADVHQLLIDGEENGNQHIFYFMPRTKKIAKSLDNAETIATAIWGPKWRTECGFPKLLLVPTGSKDLEWSDFRDNVSGKTFDWLIKIYGVDESERIDDREPEGKGEWRYYVPQFERTAFLVRWNHPDVLEIRIHRSANTSQKDLKAKLASIWQMLAGALDEKDFVPWPVTEIVRKQLAFISANATKESEKKKKSKQNDQDDDGEGEKFSTPFHPANLAMLTADGCTAKLNAMTAETFFQSEALKDSFAAFESRDGACKQTVTMWHAEPSSGIIKESLRILVGGHSSHEIVIQPHVSPEVIDYVTNQLRQIQHRTP